VLHIADWVQDVAVDWLYGQESDWTDETESTTQPQPPPDHQDQKHKHIGEQTDKELVQNFLTGDFCVHGVSSSWN